MVLTSSSTKRKILNSSTNNNGLNHKTTSTSSRRAFIGVAGAGASTTTTLAPTLSSSSSSSIDSTNRTNKMKTNLTNATNLKEKKFLDNLKSASSSSSVGGAAGCGGSSPNSTSSSPLLKSTRLNNDDSLNNNNNRAKIMKTSHLSQQLADSGRLNANNLISSNIFNNKNNRNASMSNSNLKKVDELNTKRQIQKQFQHKQHTNPNLNPNEQQSIDKHEQFLNENHNQQQIDNENLPATIGSNNNNNTLINNCANDEFALSFITKENFKKQEQLFDAKIKQLNEQLDLFNKLEDLTKSSSLSTPASALAESTGLDSVNSSSELIESFLKMSNLESGVFNYISKFKDDLKCLEKEFEENTAIVETWYEKQKQEIELQLNNECKRATQEFQEKRRELKENLKNENEEKRRQIEIDKNLLDINMDITDPKPAPTRKLRRRGGNIGSAAASSLLIDYSVDSAGNISSCLDTTASHHLIGSNSVSSSSVLLQNSVVSSGVGVCPSGLVVGSSVNSSLVLNQFGSGNNVSNLNGYYSNVLQPSFYSTIGASLINNIQSSANERKRKLSPAAITFTISEEEINDDLKHLI